MGFFNDAKHIPQSYGIRIAAGLILFFLIMWAVGLAHTVELRFLNLVILVVGVYFALKKFKQTHHDLNYFRAMITGVATSAIGSLIFAVFLFILMTVDDSLIESIKANEPMGRYLNPYIASFIPLLEGVFSGLFVTFVLINYMDTDEVNA